jgi:hypothetical protein
MRSKLLTTAAMAVAAISFSAPAHAGELVTNGGFETGNFSGWTLSGNTGFTGVSSSSPHSGTYAANLGPVGSPGTLSQWLNTVAGASYNVSFWLANDGGTPNSFQASFGSDPILLSLSNSGGFSYFDFSFTATGSSPTLLSFTYQQNPAYWHLDDVSVQGPVGGVPEPATWAMMLLGFGAMGISLRRRARSKPAIAQFA